ncbi:DUF669 domain-containing protein [Leuconostoc mesenteroides]
MAFGFVVDSNNVLGQVIEESGKYNVRVSDTSTVTMSKTNKQMAVLDFEVIDGDYAGGKIRFDNVVWDETSSEAIERSKKSFNIVLVAAAVPDGVQLTDINQFVNGLVGKQMNVSVEWEQNNKGQYNLVVKSHNKFDTTGSKPSGVKRPEGAMLPNNSASSSFDGSSASFGSQAPGTSNNSTSFGQSTLAPQQGTFTPNQMFGQGSQTPPAGPDPFANKGQAIEIDDKDLPF